MWIANAVTRSPRRDLSGMIYHRAFTPARQLGSVAGRYTRQAMCPLAPRSLPARIRSSLLAKSSESPQAADQPGERDRRIRRLEAVLFLTRDPISSRKLSRYVGLADGTEARSMVRQLNQMYDSAGRAFRVEEVAGGFQLLSRAVFAPWLRRLQHTPQETRLSAPALETLAVVAYRQPVIRADVEAIRGVSCGEMLRQLMERNLVRISGRSEELGRPYLYTTTRRFLQMFGLQSLDKLPGTKISDEVAGEVRSIAPGSSHSVSVPEAIPSFEEESEVSVSVATGDTLAPPQSKPLVPANITASTIDGEDQDDDFAEDDDFDDGESEEGGYEEVDEEEEDGEYEEDEYEDEDEDEYEDEEDDFDDGDWQEVEDEEEDEEADEEGGEDWDEDGAGEWEEDEEVDGEEEEEEDEEDWDD